MCVQAPPLKGGAYVCKSPSSEGWGLLQKHTMLKVVKHFKVGFLFQLNGKRVHTQVQPSTVYTVFLLNKHKHKPLYLDQL